MDDLILKCGDSYELIKTIPDNTVDLIIIDPPYEYVTDKGGGKFEKLSYHKEYTELGRTQLDKNKIKARKQLGSLACGFDYSILDELQRVMKKTNIYIWCSKRQLSTLLNYYEEQGCNIDLLAWHKTNPCPTANNTYLSDTEYLIFARDKGVKLHGTIATKRKYYVSSTNVEDKKIYKHPTVKPQHIIENLIINSSEAGQTILDCFLGSGTTGAAAVKLNRKFIGFEINETFFNTASKRIKEQITQITFDDLLGAQ